MLKFLNLWCSLSFKLSWCLSNILEFFQDSSLEGVPCFPDEWGYSYSSEHTDLVTFWPPGLHICYCGKAFHCRLSRIDWPQITACCQCWWMDGWSRDAHIEETSPTIPFSPDEILFKLVPWGPLHKCYRKVNDSPTTMSHNDTVSHKSWNFLNNLW